MHGKEKHLIDLLTQTGVSNWLTVVSVTVFQFEPSKQPFWD